MNKKVLIILGVGVFASFSAFGYGLYQNKDITNTDIKGKAEANCTVASNLVNSCRELIGAAVNNYQDIGFSNFTPSPQISNGIGADSQKRIKNIAYHEQRIGSKLDIIHTYHRQGDALNDTDKYFLNRDSTTTIFANYKPIITKWSDIHTADADIQKMINSVKAETNNKKIFMTLHHEPEDDVVSGATGCSTYKASASFGTPADYRYMWSYVVTKFRENNVNNVVWVMDYMNYSGWDCMVDDLYPGNDLVDWVMFNGYAMSSNEVNTGFEANIQRFISLMDSIQLSDSTKYSFSTKPWGIVEWGVRAQINPAGGYVYPDQNKYFQQAKNSIIANKFPNIKAYMIYDAQDFEDPNNDSFRVGYDSSRDFDASTQYFSEVSQNYYNQFVGSIFSKTNNNNNTADLNSDTKVNIQDLSILISKWSTNTQPADINKDGTVNIQDLSILISKWTG